MKKDTPFRIAARRFANGAYAKTESEMANNFSFSNHFCMDYYGVCEVLNNDFEDKEDIKRCKPTGDLAHRILFVELFYPHHIEREEYSSDALLWMSSRNRTPEENRNDRILALLLCEQIWLDEQGKNKSK